MTHSILKKFKQAGITSPSIQEVIECCRGLALMEQFQQLSSKHPNELAEIKQKQQANGEERYYFEVPVIEYKF